MIIKEIDGQKHEPFEYLVVEVPSEHVGPVMRLVLERQGECQRMENHGAVTQLEFHIPARGADRPAHADAERDAGHRDHAPQLPRIPAG